VGYQITSFPACPNSGWKLPVSALLWQDTISGRNRNIVPKNTGIKNFLFFIRPYFDSTFFISAYTLLFIVSCLHRITASV
jgi:hypothetical protein